MVLLKDRLNKGVIDQIAKMFSAAWVEFPSERFRSHACRGLDGLELKERGTLVADALYKALPDDYCELSRIFCKALGAETEFDDWSGDELFLYLPWSTLIENYGVNHFEESMTMQYELTKRSSAEFSMRPFLEKDSQKTLARLLEWTSDPSEHVRRLASESTRSRLPWAGRLREFQQNPEPVFPILERLKDDPSLYVRRSVANHLNDITKDHPNRVIDLLRMWKEGASEERLWLIRHAMRSLVKIGDHDALDILGYSDATSLRIERGGVSQKRVSLGESVFLECEVSNDDSIERAVNLDFIVYYVKANGATSPKVFKGKELLLFSQTSESVRKKVVLKEMSTRKHYAGIHRVDAQLNGAVFPLGSFELVMPQ